MDIILYHKHYNQEHLNAVKAEMETLAHQPSRQSGAKYTVRG